MRLRIGSRESPLARLQVEEAQQAMGRLLPEMTWEMAWFASPGDRDQKTDLTVAPADFFTRDLDEAVRAGSLDAAVHSAKDFTPTEGLDWFWLPGAQDRRDVLVGQAQPRRVGVSSDRRRAYVRRRFPDAECVPLRGTIQARLAQLDAGAMDAAVMAGAALLRLGLEDRITAWIPLADLEPPEGQGSLAMVFRKGDARFLRLRTLFCRPVVLVSAGPAAGLCTVAGLEALRQADICLHDALIDTALLEQLPASVVRKYVGKRHGRHSYAQTDICQMLLDYARQGKRVVRLKGGDAGLYGRLAEEVEALDAHELPYRVIPGVSSMTAATTGTGLLLTRRGVTDRIHVLSGHAAASHHPRAAGPVSEVVFMGTRCLAEIAAERLAEGFAPDTPMMLICAAGQEKETVVAGTLEAPPAIPSVMQGQPGLILIGQAMHGQYAYKEHGALRGRRVWLTCSAAVRVAAENAVRAFGGRPVWQPLLQLVPEPFSVDWQAYDWVVVTSPSAVRALLHGLDDVRCLPKVLCCGPGTAAALRRARIWPDAMPEAAFSTDGVVACAEKEFQPTDRVLRVRSDRAGSVLADRLREHAAQVEDRIVCRNERLEADMPPAFDVVLFASASAVESFMVQFGARALDAKQVAVMGQKETSVLQAHGVHAVVAPEEHTLNGTLASLAARCVAKEMMQ